MTAVIVIVPDDENIPVGTQDEEASVLEAVQQSIDEANEEDTATSDEDS